MTKAAATSSLARWLWLLWAAALAALWVSAWLWPAWHHGLAQWFQRLYGTPFDTSPWYLRGNAPLHVVATLLASLCLWVGMRVWLPRLPAWWGLLATALIGLGDELAQRCSATRGFDVREWQADAAGLILAVLILWGWYGLRPGRVTKQDGGP